MNNILYTSLFKKFQSIFLTWKQTSSPKKAFSEEVYVFSCHLIAILTLNRQSDSCLFEFLQNSHQLRLLIFKTYYDKGKNTIEPLLLMEQAIGLLILTGEISESHMKFIKKLQQFLMDILSEKRISKTTLIYKKVIESKNSKTKAFYTKIFYVYRLTFTHPISLEKFFYYGYRGCMAAPLADSSYWSSSKTVKQTLKEFGATCFKKKILGVYTWIDTALNREIFLHKKFDVKNNPKFMNRANQTSTKFQFERTGIPQSEISNKKRSKALRGRVFSPETRERMRQSHLNRVRSEEETRGRREAMIRTNQQVAICPHCGLQVGMPGGRRWHFNNCLQNPNVSEDAIRDHERVRQAQIERNKNRSRNRRKDKKEDS
uniref:Putative site-specific DNA endonuclease n=1 Tax=Stigeoclonium helveticum TaxID=55999 RepID=Q06SE9_STIHE|nr:putative site-specific DNA endonuclease [Stigeoclonium helveticum]ABF60218.1 putative site-specific DNA endonuclease [Stigeoclonium helveticum]